VKKIKFTMGFLLLVYTMIYSSDCFARTDSTNEFLLIQTINEIINAIKIKDIQLYNLQVSSNYLEYLQNNDSEPAGISNELAKEILIKPLKTGGFYDLVYKVQTMDFVVLKKEKIDNNYKLEVEFSVVYKESNNIEKNDKFVLKFEMEPYLNKLWKITKIE